MKYLLGVVLVATVFICMVDSKTQVYYSIDCRAGVTLNSSPLEGEPDFNKLGGVLRPANSKKFKCGFRRYPVKPSQFTLIDLDGWVPYYHPDFELIPFKNNASPQSLQLCTPEENCGDCSKPASLTGQKDCVFKIWTKADNQIIYFTICEFNELISCQDICQNGQVFTPHSIQKNQVIIKNKYAL
jgi:hypothetical protein